MTTYDETELNAPRIQDAKSARGIFRTYEQGNSARAKIMAQTRNQIDGGRPMDPAQLERDGGAWQTNVNFRDAESAFNRTFLPYWKMVHDVPNKIAVSIENQSPHKAKWEKAMSESFDLFLDDWGSDYLFQFMLYTNDFVKFGPGYVMWADGDSPRFEHARTEHVFLPKRAKANVSKWEICAIKSEMTISDLWSKIRSPKSEKRSAFVGWNKAMVKKAILCAMKSNGENSDASNWTAAQDRLVSNDFSISECGVPIEIVRMFTKGHDGKVACHVFTVSEDVPDFLFSKEDYADEFKHTVAGLFYDVGTAGLVHSIKGFAIKNYYFSLLQNRMKSRLMDAATISMSFNFQREDDNAAESPPVENYGAMNVFPKGMKQIPIYPQLSGVQAALGILSSNAADNNFIYRDSSKDIAETGTARQAVILANLSEEIGSATASIYLSQVGEGPFTEATRRLMKPGSRDPDAVKFRQRLVSRGVPAGVIDQLEYKVKTGANPGTAGAALRDMILKELMGMIRLPGVNARAILENYIANKLGTNAVKTYLLPEGVESAPAQRRAAMIENSLFGQGMPLPVDPADAHFEHSDEHLKPLVQIIQAYKQAGNLPPEALVALKYAIEHTSQHFEFMKADEMAAEQYKQLWPTFSQVHSIALGIFTQMQQQQQQEPQGGEAIQ